jgi:transposase-like protein
MDRLTWLRKTLEDADLDVMREMLREGSHYPDWLLENRRRAERALVAVIAERYVRGVSTRRVDGLVKTLGIEGISKSQVSRLARTLDEEVAAFRSRPLEEGAYPYLWVDALAIRVREGGRVVKVACIAATEVSSEGRRDDARGRGSRHHGILHVPDGALAPDLVQRSSGTPQP